MVSPYAYAGIKDIIPKEKNVPVERQVKEANRIIKEVCNYYSIKRNQLVNDRRVMPYVEYRHICWLLIREKTGMSSTKLGMLFDRDHSSILLGIKSIKKLLDTKEEKLTTQVTQLRMIL